MQLDRHSLGKIYDKVGGIIRTGPFGSQLHESDYKEEGIPVVMPKNIVDGKISIENNTRRIAILEEMAQSLYREWFMHFRFPRHEKKRLVESELGLIPEGWEVRNISEFGAVVTGKTPSKLHSEFLVMNICLLLKHQICMVRSFASKLKKVYQNKEPCRREIKHYHLIAYVSAALAQQE